MKRLDAAITKFVQNWIADPLQFSGIVLEWQVLAASVIIVVGFIWCDYFDIIRQDWFWIGIDGLATPLMIIYVMYALTSPGHKMFIRNNVSWSLILAAFTAADVVRLSVIGFRYYGNDAVALFDFGLFLRNYLLKCKPKPPVGNQKVATESA